MAHARLDIYFEVGVRWDDRTKTHLAYAPAFRIYAQGNTVDEALQANTHAVEICFRTLAKTSEVFDALSRYEIPIYSSTDPVPADRRHYARRTLEEAGFKTIREQHLALA
jgi:hypothetical protein